MATDKTYTLTAAQLCRVIQCLARAESEGAFKNCVVPDVGTKTLDMLENIRASVSETWEGSPCSEDTANFWINDKTGERIRAGA